MSIERQKKLIEEAGGLGLAIPGLTLDPIIEKIASASPEIKKNKEIIEKERDTKIKRGEDREKARQEARDKISEMIKKFKDSLKDYVNEQIALIKQQYKVFMDGIKRIPEDVKTAIQNIALPPAITAPPGAPNPVYALNIAKQTKAALIGTLGIIIVAFTEILKAANKILFELPDSLLTMFEQIKLAFGIINSIPV